MSGGRWLFLIVNRLWLVDGLVRLGWNVTRRWWRDDEGIDHWEAHIYRPRRSSR